MLVFPNKIVIEYSIPGRSRMAELDLYGGAGLSGIPGFGDGQIPDRTRPPCAILVKAREQQGSRGFCLFFDFSILIYYY